MSSVVFYEIEDWEIEYLQKKISGESLFYSKLKGHEEKNDQFYQASVISTFIYSELTRDFLSKFSNLKLITTRSTGYDHIDLDYCKEKRISVVNVPSYGAHTVAEHTFALILAISRKLIETIDRSKRGDFSLRGLTGFDIAGKTLGVIGTGKIGGKVIKLAQAFEMNVLVLTRHPEELQGQINVNASPLEEILAQSDIVTLHLPLTKETQHIINKNNINLFKKGSVLINTARGSLIETQAILDGLESGILSAVGLDVVEEECSLKEERELLTDEFLKGCDIKTQLLNHVLLTRDDVLFTSHNGFNSHESVRQILDVTVENIKQFEKGTIQNSVL
ncbi:MAG TPA: NAD(P)-dependent oxidoreductase [Candidatus Sulfotelmatobacter sp.]|jgi:D-lactate dehydrogenase|nr:NAD(P)-dependent oxidoreductase [Candidatus Sulfotelmatobacter sp.]